MDPVVRTLHHCLERMQTAGCDRGSHRQAGARLSHNHRICKDFNNDPLGLMIDNRSGVNAHAYVNADLRRPIYWGSLRATWQTLSDCTRIRNTRVDLTEKHTAIMVKNFSADWLAQSFHAAAPDDVPEPEKKRHRPHVPCLAQPRPPTSYDKIYLQPKPKVAKVEQKPESTSVPKEKEALVPVASRHCSSPSSKYLTINLVRSALPVYIKINNDGQWFNSILCSVSENSGYSSGYESEAAASECASVEDGHELEKEAVQRRIRTKFTPEQIDKLEKIFNKHKYLDAGERIKTALKLNLSETQVRYIYAFGRRCIQVIKYSPSLTAVKFHLEKKLLKHMLTVRFAVFQVRTWFQNRRMKLKREVQEMQADYFLPALVLPHVHPGVQYHCYDRQRFQFPAQVLNGPVMHHHHQISAQHRIPHHHMMMSQHYYWHSFHENTYITFSVQYMYSLTRCIEYSQVKMFNYKEEFIYCEK